MHDAARMRVTETGAELFDEEQPARETEGLGLADELAERLSVDVLHRDERLPVLLTDEEDRHDVAVIEPRRRARLARETLPQLLVVATEQLDRD